MRTLLELSRRGRQGCSPSHTLRSMCGGDPLSALGLRNLALSSVTGGIILLDQLTKQQIMQTMRLHESISVIPNLLSLTYIRNPGAAFGLLAGSSNAFRMVFFGLTSIFALGLL